MEMKRTSATVLFAFLLLAKTYSQMQPRFRVTLKIIGLYSICGRNTSNVSMATEFHFKAVSMHLGVLYALHKEQLEDDLHYEAYDVCNNSTILLSRLIDIMLDPKYMKETNSSTNTTSIPCIFSFMTEDLTKLSANILTGGDIPMISFNNHQFFPDALSHALYLRRGELEDHNVDYYRKLLKELGYDFPFVISLNETHGTHEYYKGLVKSLKNDTCIIYQSLKNKFEIGRFFGKLLSYRRPQVLVAMTDGKSLRKILPYAKAIAHLFIPIYSVKKSGKFHKEATSTIQNIVRTRNITSDPLFGHNLEIEIGQYDYSYILIEFRILIDEMMTLLQSDPGNNTLADHLISSLKSEILRSQRKPTICTNFTCGPGYERQIQKIERDLWKNRYSFVCVKCKQNYTKPTTGRGSCEPCYGKNISNKYNTRCYVPYQMITVDFTSVEGVFGIVLNSFAMGFSFMALILFERFRKSPVVRASDIKLSQFQLLATNFLFLFILLSVTLELNRTLCTAKPICIGASFSFFIAVTLAKAEKPLTVFSKQRKLTKKDINKTEAQQYLIMVILPIVSVLISMMSIHFKPIDLLVTTNEAVLTKIFHCNTDNHVLVQTLYIFILLIASLVQAYRSRNIPHNYSESMTIMYSTFTCCVFLLVLIIISHFQKDPIDRFIIQWIMFCVIGLVLSLASYGKKVVTLLFYPEKNTVQAFRKGSTRSMKLSKNLSFELEDRKENEYTTFIEESTIDTTI